VTSQARVWPSCRGWPRAVRRGPGGRASTAGRLGSTSDPCGSSDQPGMRQSLPSACCNVPEIVDVQVGRYLCRRSGRDGRPCRCGSPCRPGSRADPTCTRSLTNHTPQATGRSVTPDRPTTPLTCVYFVSDASEGSTIRHRHPPLQPAYPLLTRPLLRQPLSVEDASTLLYRGRDEFRPHRRYVLTSSPEYPGRTDHKGESDVRQSCGRRGRHPGRTG